VKKQKTRKKKDEAILPPPMLICTHNLRNVPWTLAFRARNSNPSTTAFQNRSPNQKKHTKEPNPKKSTRKNTITSLVHNVFRIRKEEMLRAEPRSMISCEACSKVPAHDCVLQDLCCAQPSARSVEQGQAGGRREIPFHTECTLPHQGNAGVPSHLNPGGLN
jgi:hypothetical protein